MKKSISLRKTENAKQRRHIEIPGNAGGGYLWLQN